MSKIKSYTVNVLKYSSLIAEFPECKEELIIIKDRMSRLTYDFSNQRLLSVKILVDKIDNYSKYYLYECPIRQNKLNDIKLFLIKDYIDCLLDIDDICTFGKVECPGKNNKWSCKKCDKCLNN